jgi:hypothetical protein
VRTTKVEKWLRKLKLAGGKAKIRSIMSVLFNHAIRHELMPQGTNPITTVRQSAKRMQIPDILEAWGVRSALRSAIASGEGNGAAGRSHRTSPERPDGSQVARRGLRAT